MRGDGGGRRRTGCLPARRSAGVRAGPGRTDPARARTARQYPVRGTGRIADTLVNLLTDDRIALLFLIPGVGDTFRVNGRAIITDDAELLSGSAVATPLGAPEGRAPKLGVIVDVHEAYVQCPKALIRSALWDPEHHVQRASLPSLGEILGEAQAVSEPDFDAAEYDRERAARYARGDGLY